MTQLLRLKALWTGFVGAPGYTNFYFGVPGGADGAWITPEGVTSAVGKVDAFLNVLNSKLPPQVNLNQDTTAEVIAVADGRIFDFETVNPFMRGPGTGNGSYSAASGAVVNWYTDGVRNGRRVRGRSFLVPLAGSALGANGTIDDLALGQLQDAAKALHAPGAGGIQLHVWGRPTRVKDPVTGKPTGESLPDGVAHPVTSMRMSDKVAVLRSRRD